jgi:hypothetical protein
MANPVFVVTACLALMMSAGAVSTRGAQIVWSGLVLAENVDQPSEVPPELSGIEQTLKDLFGYNQFEIIGQSRKTLKTGEEDWLAASKYFALHVDAQGESDSGYAVKLKLYKEKDLLLETDTKLSKQSPLVIKGPLVGNAQLLLVLVAEEHPNASGSGHHGHRQSNQLVTAWRKLTRVVRGFLP